MGPSELISAFSNGTSTFKFHQIEENVMKKAGGHVWGSEPHIHCNHKGRINNKSKLVLTASAAD